MHKDRIFLYYIFFLIFISFLIILLTLELDIKEYRFFDRLRPKKKLKRLPLKELNRKWLKVLYYCHKLYPISDIIFPILFLLLSGLQYRGWVKLNSAKIQYCTILKDLQAAKAKYLPLIKEFKNKEKTLKEDPNLRSLNNLTKKQIVQKFEISKSKKEDYAKTISGNNKKRELIQELRSTDQKHIRDLNILKDLEIKLEKAGLNYTNEKADFKAFSTEVVLFLIFLILLVILKELFKPSLNKVFNKIKRPQIVESYEKKLAREVKFRKKQLIIEKKKDVSALEKNRVIVSEALEGLDLLTK